MAVIQGFLQQPREERPPLELSVEAGLRQDPDRHAKAVQLGNEYEVDPNYVSEHLDAFESQSRRDRIDTDEIRRRAPRLAEWMREPDNAAVSHDEIAELIGMEEYLQRAGRPWYDFRTESTEGLGGAMSEGIKQAGRAAQLGALDWLDTSDPTFAERLLENMMPMPGPKRLVREAMQLFASDEQRAQLDEARQPAVDALIREIQVGDKRIQDLTPEDMTLMEEAFRSAVQSVTENLPGMALSAASRSTVPSLASAGMLTMARSYGSARAEGKAPGEAAHYAGVDASIEVLTEILPSKALLKIFGNEKGSFWKGLRDFVLSDMAGEQVATIGQSLNAYARGLDEELERAEGLDAKLAVMGERMAVTGLATIMGGGAQAGIAKGAGVIVNKTVGRVAEEANRIQQSVADADFMDQVIQLAQSHKTRERAPEAYKQFIDQNGERTVYIDADLVREVLNQEVQAPAAVQKQLDEGAQVVELTMGDLLSDTGFAAAVKDGVKLDLDRLSRRELNDNPSDKIRRLVEQATRNLEEQSAIDEAMDALVVQLAGTRRMSTNEAKLSIQPLDSYLRRVASEYGKRGATPEEVVEIMALRVMRPEERVAYLREKAAQGRRQPRKVLSSPAFGDLEITERVKVRETGEEMEVKTRVQRKWDQEAKRHGVLEQVARCVRGA